MRIRMKTLLICSLVAILSIYVIFGISANILLQRAQISESEYLSAEINQVHIGLSYEFFRIHTEVADWAYWDDSYQFIEDNNTNYIDVNIVPQAFQDLNLNLMLYVNLNGTIIYEKAFDLATLSEISINSSQMISNYPSIILTETENDTGTTGIVNTPEGLMLVSSAPILTSDYQGPARGVIIFGRFLDGNEILLLSEIVGLPINICNIHESEMDSNFLSANNSLSLETNSIVLPINETFAAGYSLITDLNETPVAIEQIQAARVEYEQAKTSLLYLGLSMAVVGFILIALIILLLNKFVLARLAQLSSNVGQFRINEGHMTPLALEGNDEISNLANKVNEMTGVIAKNQASLEDYASNLEKKVNEKTKELVETQEKLMQAERLSVIGQLAAIVGHDLRNPLQGIKNAVQYLRKNANKQLNNDSKKMLDFIDKDVESANKIVNDLLDYSREIKLQKEVKKLNELISDSINSVNMPKEVQVIEEIENSIEVNVDAARIKRVFVNLISNAIEAMPDGGKLTIKSTLAEKNLEVSFSDTGTGIAQEDMDKLWKPLFTTKTKGTGLGLVICKRLIEAHGGNIKVTSETDKGTTFTISLPI